MAAQLQVGNRPKSLETTQDTKKMGFAVDGFYNTNSAIKNPFTPLPLSIV